MSGPPISPATGPGATGDRPAAGGARDLFDLCGRNALVTGASSGLGRHFARVLARAGAGVALVARRRAPLEALAVEIGTLGVRGVPLVADVRDEGSVCEAFARAEEALGPMHVVVNNAGVALARPALDQTESEWRRVVDTNLLGAWLVAREAARRMVAAEVPGSIINVASILAFRVVSALSSYAAAKAGLVQFTRALSLERARHRIRVNAIAPGYILTGMNRGFFASPPGQAMVRRIPQQRLGVPEDLDGVLLLLASDAASGYMTGSVISVDGGHLNSSL